MTTLLDISLDQILPDPNQPRKYFNEQAISELADSIKQYGLLQPILVRPNGNQSYLIVHGERRYKAHQKAQLPTIRCIVRELTDSEVSDMQLVENLERDDLSDIDLAREFQRRVDASQTHEQIAKIIGRSRGFVTQRLLLLRLSVEDQHKLEKGELDFTAARILASQRNNGEEQKKDQCYAVTMEKLEVYNLFQNNPKPSLDVLHQAYRADLVTIRRALRSH